MSAARLVATLAVAIVPSAELLGQSVLVAPLVGPAESGTLVDLSIDCVVIRGDAGVSTIAAERLPRLGFANAQTPRRRATLNDADAGSADGRRRGVVRLVDGSRLPVKGVQTTPGGDRVEFEAVVGGATAPLAAPADLIRSIRLPGAAAGHDAAWRALSSQLPANDLIVTAPRSGGSLDYVEGFVEAINASTLTLVLEDESVEVPRSRVYGVVLAAEGGAAESEVAGGEVAESDQTTLPAGPRLTTIDGARLSVAAIELTPKQQVVIRTHAGLVISVPVAGVRSLDYSVGRLIPLGGLSPTRVTRSPLLGTPRGVADAPKPAVVRRDAAYWGGPLTLIDAAAPVTGRRVFEQGVAVRSGGDAAYRVPAGAKRFQAFAGVDPAAASSTVLRLVIEVDGSPVVDQLLDHATPPLLIDLPVDRSRSLRLIVERNRGLDATLHLGDARFIR